MLASGVHLHPTSRGIFTCRQLIYCSIFKLMAWAIIKSAPMIISFTISATIKTRLTLIFDIVNFASAFPSTVADSLVAAGSLVLLNTTQVCCLPFMYPHSVRLLLFCCVTDKEIVGPSHASQRQLLLV